MKEVGKTYNSYKEIGHLFYGGKEIKKMFFGGNLVYSLGGGFERITLPDGVDGDHIIKVGGYIVLYGKYQSNGQFPLFHRFQNGEYVDTLVGYGGSTLYWYPFYDNEFLAIYTQDADGQNYFYTLNAGGVSARIQTPYINFRTGIVFGDRILLANICQYNVSSVWDGYSALFTEEERNNFLHIPHIWSAIKIDSVGNPVEYEEYHRYSISLDTDVQRCESTSDDPKEPYYELDEPLILSIVKDSVTGKIYGEVATHYCRGHWSSENKAYYIYAKYEIKKLDIKKGTVELGEPFEEPTWIEAVKYRNVTNCTSFVLNQYRKYGSYMIEGDAGYPSGTQANKRAYFINDFITFAKYVLRRSTQNDNGYRSNCSYCFDSVWTGVYKNKYYCINPNDIYYRYYTYPWQNEQYNTTDFVTKNDMGTPKYPKAELGTTYQQSKNAWGVDGLYHFGSMVVTDETTGANTTVPCMYFYNEL